MDDDNATLCEIVSRNHKQLKNIKNAGGSIVAGNKRTDRKSPVSGTRRKFHLLGAFLKICHFENSEVLLLEETMLN